MMANIHGQTTGYKGYKNAIHTQMGIWCNQGSIAVPLSPDEGAVSVTGAVTYTPPAGSGTNINYIGIDNAGADDRSSPYSGVFSLVYNGATDNAGDDETGYIANIATSNQTTSILRSIALVKPLPSSYPVDIQLTPAAGLNRKVTPYKKNYGKNLG